MFTSSFGVLSVIQSSDRVFRLPGTGMQVPVISPVLVAMLIIGLRHRIPPMAPAITCTFTAAEWPRAISPTEPPVILSAASKNLRLSGGLFSIKNY